MAALWKMGVRIRGYYRDMAWSDGGMKWHDSDDGGEEGISRLNVRS